MGQADLEHFRIVKRKPNKSLTQSGTCALCGCKYLFGNRVIAEYKETPTDHIITEPFNLCDSCFEFHRKPNDRTIQTTLDNASRTPKR